MNKKPEAFQGNPAKGIFIGIIGSTLIYVIVAFLVFG
jgi:hypothetical protein